MAYNLARRQDFGPVCPSGGTWYACGYGTFFVGCCARDPCSITCAQGDLYPAGFDPSKHATFPDAECGDGVQFWTCTAGPTFMGCCKANPCSNSGICPQGYLAPAFLKRDDLRSAYHATGGPSPTRATTQATSTVSTTSTAAPTTTDDAQTHATEKKTNVGAIAGGAAGGAFALAVILGLLVYYVCHAKKSRRGHADSVGQRLSLATGREKDGIVGSPGLPPGYYSPDPNGNYHQDGGYYQTYGGFQQYPQYRPEPQEMAIDSVEGVYNPAARSHRRDPSELSGETTLASPHKPTFSGHPSPEQFGQHSQQHTPRQFEHQDPQQFDHQQHEPQEPRTPQDDPAVQSWMAHQSWRPQSTEYPQATEYPQGLGVQAWRREEQEGTGQGR